MAVTDYFEDFTLIAVREESDGLGHVYPVVDTLTTFRAGIYMNNTSSAQLAYQEGAKTIATIVTGLDDELEHDDYIRRERDGMIYRVIGDAANNTAPDVAVFTRLRAVQAEVYML